jgi:hypothetical protein
MLVLGTINLWLRLRKGIVGFIRTRNTVCANMADLS